MGCGESKKVITALERSEKPDISSPNGLAGHDKLVYMRRKLLKINCPTGIKSIPYTLPTPKAVSSMYIPF